jgi:integrase/recombinase XerD
MAWAKEHGVTALEGLTAPLIRRYIDHLQHRPTKAGKLLDSFTVHGHVRAIRTLLFWAASEDLIDEKIPKRIAPPRREQKVLAVLSDEQMSRLFRVAQSTDTPTRDVALLSLLLDTGCRASELTGLTLDDVHLTADDAWILVRGKGRKQRQVALGHRARADLARYLHRTRRAPTIERHVFLGRTTRIPRQERATYSRRSGQATVQTSRSSGGGTLQGRVGSCSPVAAYPRGQGSGGWD